MELQREIEALARETAGAVSRTEKQYDRSTGKVSDVTRVIITDTQAANKSIENIERGLANTVQVMEGVQGTYKDLASSAKANMEVIQNNFDELGKAADEFGQRFQKAVDENVIGALRNFNTELEKLVSTGIQDVYFELKHNLEETEQKAKDLRAHLLSLSEPRDIVLTDSKVDSATEKIKKLRDEVEELRKGKTDVKVESPSADQVMRKFEQINRFKFQTKYVDVVYREKKNLGGPVMGFSRGGNVPGSGSGDTVPAMLTPKEYVQPVPAVEKYGVGFMEALRRRLIPKEAIDAIMQNKRKTTITKPSVSFNTGGSVSSRSSSSSTPTNFGTLTLAVGNDTFPVQAPIDVMEQLSLSIRRKRLARGN
jgi:hypothetical protein